MGQYLSNGCKERRRISATTVWIDTLKMVLEIKWHFIGKQYFNCSRSCRKQRGYFSSKFRVVSLTGNVHVCCFILWPVFTSGRCNPRIPNIWRCNAFTYPKFTLSDFRKLFELSKLQTKSDEVISKQIFICWHPTPSDYCSFHISRAQSDSYFFLLFLLF